MVPVIIVSVSVISFMLTADSISLFVTTNIIMVLIAVALKYLNLQKFLVKFPYKYVLTISSCIIFFTLHVWNIIGSRQLDATLKKIEARGYITTAQQVNDMYNKEVVPKENGGALVAALANIISERTHEFSRKVLAYQDHGFHFDSEFIFRNEEARKHVAKILNDLDNELVMLEKALVYPQLIVPLKFSQKEMYSMELPHLSSLAQVVEILQYKFLYQIEKKQSQQSLKTLRQIFQIGDILEFEPILISQLVKNSMQKSTFKVIANAMNYESDTQTLQEFVKFIEPRCVYKPIRLEAEFIFIQGVFVDIQSDDYNLASALDLPFANIIPHGFMKQDIAYALNYTLKNVLTNYGGEKAVRFTLDKKEQIENWYPISNMLLPATTQINKVVFESLAIARSTFAGLHMRLQQLKSQQVDFTEIKKKYPLHTTDPFTGKTLLNTTTKEGYIIYSVGKNLKNDGGMAKKGVDTGILLRKEK